MELVQAKYLKETNILHYCSKPGDSPMWKGIANCAQKLNIKFRWQVGNGATILFWLDPWFTNEGLYKQMTFVDKRD